MHLRGYGWVKVFRFVRNDRRTDYIATNEENLSRNDIETIMKMRWNIEVYHRELKQTCGIERCMSRTGRAQRNHICLAVLAWFFRLRKRLLESTSFYQQQLDVIKPAIKSNLRFFMA